MRISSVASSTTGRKIPKGWEPSLNPHSEEQPPHKHYPVAEYITPEQFRIYREIGLKKGFKEVESAPLVRSSYHAEKHIKFKG